MNDRPKVQLIEHLIGEPLGDWVGQHRKDGKTCEWIASEVEIKSNGKVSITAAYLHRLFRNTADLPQRRAAS
jgi:hypothetical protein